MPHPRASHLPELYCRRTNGARIQLEKAESTRRSLWTVLCTSVRYRCEDVPQCLIKHSLTRLRSLSTETVVINKGDARHDMGCVAYLRMQEAALQEKAPRTDLVIPRPAVLDEEALVILQAMQHGEVSATHMDVQTTAKNGKPETSSSSPSRDWIGISTIACPRESLQDEVRACLEELSGKDHGKYLIRFDGCYTDRLVASEAAILDLAHINLYLADMNEFAAVNAVYNTFFGPSPPTRACVSAILPRGIRLQLDAIAACGDSADRTALHVRSLSYWAPANIGPYSQAVRVSC